MVTLIFFMVFFTRFLDVETFGLTMLGEVGLFYHYGEQIRDNVATALLIVHLVIMNIMSLNLLIAVLKTACCNVEEDAKTKFNMSKVKTI